MYRLPPPRLESVDLGALVGEAVAFLSPRASEHGVDVTVAGDPTWPTVRVDRAQVGQALVNVVKNAIEAAGRGGWVRARHVVGDDGPRLLVEDSGPGLTDDARQNVFTPFFSTKEGGQGVGLTLVQEVLANHGFDFALESTPGAPTTFTIAFRQR